MHKPVKRIFSEMAFLLMTLTVMSLVSCKSKNVSLNKITGDWKIISFTEFDVDELCEATISITKEENGNFSISGFSGVNQFFAAMSYSDSFPVGDKLASTKMMGDEQQMRFEDSLLHLLATAPDWTLKKGILTVSNGIKKAEFIPR